MVGLYKDPDGDTITTFVASTHREESTTENSGNNIELKRLRRRVLELENSLKQNVSHHSRSLFITSVKINEGRDDTVPKTVDTRKHCKVELIACNNLLPPQKFKM